MYDWAEAAFALTVMAAFFPGFFKGFWCHGTDAAISTARLGIGLAIGGAIVAVLSPVLGSIAGAGHSKKSWLAFFAVLGSLATMSLFYVPKGEWIVALVVFVIARSGYFLSNIFNDAFLLDLTERENSDMVSSYGFAAGYIGCAVLFIINLVMYTKPAFFGIRSAVDAVRFSFVSAGLWWLIFSLPLFLFVKPIHKPDRKPLGAIVHEGLGLTIATFREMAAKKGVLLFLLAYWFYIDGVNTVVAMATDFGLSIGLNMGKLMMTLLVVQLVAFPSAIIFGRIAKFTGAKNAVLITIGTYVLITSIGPFAVHSEMQFMLFAGLTGAVQGAVQALSRSFFARMIPQDRETEWFGVYNMMGRFAVAVGPLVVAMSALFSRYVIHAGADMSPRIGVSMLSVLFVIGGMILWKVSPDKV